MRESEKLTISIAFRLALSELSKKLCRSSIMFIDESFVSYDTKRKMMIENVLVEILTRYEKVFLISHMNELKDRVKDTISIVKNDNISTIIGSDLIEFNIPTVHRAPIIEQPKVYKGERFTCDKCNKDYSKAGLKGHKCKGMKI